MTGAYAADTPISPIDIAIGKMADWPHQDSLDSTRYTALRSLCNNATTSIGRFWLLLVGGPVPTYCRSYSTTSLARATCRSIRSTQVAGQSENSTLLQKIYLLSKGKSKTKLNRTATITRAITKGYGICGLQSPHGRSNHKPSTGSCSGAAQDRRRWRRIKAGESSGIGERKQPHPIVAK